jgi:hypothetical protein
VHWRGYLSVVVDVLEVAVDPVSASVTINIMPLYHIPFQAQATGSFLVGIDQFLLDHCLALLKMNKSTAVVVARR